MKQLKPMVFMTALALMALLGAPALSLAQEIPTSPRWTQSTKS